MKNFIVLVAVFAIVRLLTPLLVLYQTLRMRFWRLRVRRATDDEVPPHVREGLASGIEELARLGFEPLGWLVQDREDVPGDVPRCCAYLFHPTARAYAALSFASRPDPIAPWSVTFWTFGEGDRVAETSDGSDRSLLGEPPGTIAAAPFAATIEGQWEAHRRAAVDLVPSNLDHDAVFARRCDRERAQFEAAVRGGGALPAGASAYMLSWGLALRLTRRLLSDAPRVTALRHQRESLARTSPPPPIPIEEEALAYRRVQDTNGPPRAGFLAALFVVTLSLFLAATWYSTGTATVTAIVVAVVLFHELGHYLAMRAFGYVDTSIFFVPFLGGVAYGRKDGATFVERLVVLFAGPLPGLLVAIALRALHPESSTLLLEVLLILVAVNLFNLLPILPLDGGQIAHMLFFWRRPWLDVASRAIAGVCLLVLAWKASTTFLGVIGALMLLQLPRSLRMSRLRRQLYDARTTWPGEDPVRLFFRVVPSTAFGRKSFTRKMIVARVVLAQPMLDAPLRPREVLGGLSAYAAVIAVGVVPAMLPFAPAPGAAALLSPRPRHVDAAASLACPEASSPDPDPAAKTAFVPSSGVAMFPSPEALAAAQVQLVAAIPDSIVRSVGPVLFVWHPSSDDAELDDDEEEATEAVWKEQSQRVQAALSAAGARGYAPGKATPAIECTAPDEVVARSIDDVLEDYIVMRRNAMEVPAPWSGADEATPAQQLARSTFRVAVTARDAVRFKPPPRSLWATVTRARGKDAVRELHAQLVGAVQDALATARAAHPIDEQVARLFLAKIGGPADAKANMDAELRDRLGATTNGRAILQKVSRAGTTVQVDFPYLEPWNVDQDIGPMLRWLCAHACATRILLETR